MNQLQVPNEQSSLLSSNLFQDEKRGCEWLSEVQKLNRQILAFYIQKARLFKVMPQLNDATRREDVYKSLGWTQRVDHIYLFCFVLMSLIYIYISETSLV